MEADKKLDHIQDISIKLEPSEASDANQICSRQTIRGQRDVRNQNFDGIIEQLFDFFKKQQIQLNTSKSRLSIDEGMMRCQLEYLLGINPRKRTKKDIKNIITELKSLEYFTKTVFKGESKNSQRLNQLIKRQNFILLQLIAPFVNIRYYEQGSVIQETGKQRQAMHFLLQGQINLFEPINHTMFRNCIKRAEDLRLNQKYQRSRLNKNSEQDQSTVVNQTDEYAQNAQIKSNCHTAPNSDNSRVKTPKEISLQSRISSTACYQIIACRGIQRKETKHRLAKVLNSTDLICAIDSPTFLKQKSVYEVTAICSTSSYIMEIDYNVAEKICFLVNMDQEKAYTQALLLKFPELLFRHVHKFIHHDFIIDRRQNKYFLSDFIKNSKLLKSQQFLRDQEKCKESQKGIVDEQDRIQGFSSEIAHTGKIYFLMQGQVKLIMNKRMQKSSESQLQKHNLKRKIVNYTRKQILSINGPNLFGFQAIGQQDNHNLVYLTNPNCKILELNQVALQQTFYDVPQFQDNFQKIRNQRNIILQEFRSKIQNSQKNIRISRTKAASNAQLIARSTNNQNFYDQIQKQINLKEKIRNQDTNNGQRIFIRNPEIKSQQSIKIDTDKTFNNKISSSKLDILQKEGKLLRIKRQNSLMQATHGFGKFQLNKMETKSGKMIQFQGDFIVLKSNKGQFERMRRVSDFKLNRIPRSSTYSKKENEENRKQQSIDSFAKRGTVKKISQKNIGIIFNERMEQYFSQKLIESKQKQTKSNIYFKLFKRQKLRFQNSLKSGKRFISGRADIQFKNLHNIMK